MLSDRCLSCLSVCNVGVLWPNGWMDRDATWYGGRPRPRRQYVIIKGSDGRRKEVRPNPTIAYDTELQ